MLTRYIDYVPVVMNSLITGYYLFLARPLQFGKTTYWAGATILTVGLSLMRG